MPKATCQLNLTLEVPVAETVERISRDAHLRPSGAGRVLLEQRLALEAAGWRLEDRELNTILEAVCRLKADHLEGLKGYLRGIVSEDILPKTGSVR